MRISDWSSDVCSSDLIKRDVEELFCHRLEPLEQMPSRRLACRHVGQNQRAPAPAARGKRLQQAIAVDETGGLVVDDDDRKIGPFDKARDDRRDSGRSVDHRSEEHTSELQSLMRISYAVFLL